MLYNNLEQVLYNYDNEELILYKGTYDENDFMSFDTLDTFNRKNRWDLIVSNVINNPDFYTALNSLNRKSFNIR